MDRPDTTAALAAVDRHLDAFIQELQDLCRLRSRRQEPEQMAATAEFVAAALRRRGGTADVVPWEHSHPYVLGEISGIDGHASAPRLLHFNHYDVEVEPPGDDNAWTSPPYAAQIRDGRLFARGVADDKAALLSRVHAAAAWQLSGQSPPVTSRYLVEGKQHVHSPGLESFVRAHEDRLASSAALWENSWRDEAGRPLLKLGEKGVLYLRLHIRTLARDLTSQNTALLPAATTRLAACLASLQDADGNVLVPGFHDDVRPLSEGDRAQLRQLRLDGAFLKARAGVPRFRGNLDDAAAAEAIRTVPTLTVTGIEGGDTSDEVTLGIPSTAAAKIEVRLVPDQQPDRVLAALRAHIERCGFADIEIETLGRSCPHRTDASDPFVALVADAAHRAYDSEPLVEPASQWIGNQGVLLGRPIVGVGVSRADSGVDGPDEHVQVEDYRLGIRHVIEVMAAMGAR